MNKLPGSGASSFDNPATYKICVQGRISANWSDRLEGMIITLDQVGDALPVTTLVGELSDQTALAGVLKTIHELHLAVLSVARLDNEQDSSMTTTAI